MRTPEIPSGAEIVRTFAEFTRLVDAFFRGYYQLLIIIGRAGLGKSAAFEPLLGDTSHLIRGWIAPLRAYMETYLHRNKLLIFDDAEVLWKKPGGRVLMRSITEHKPQKLVEWTSTVKDLEMEGIPRSFLTSSKVALVGNRFVFGQDDEVEAILDRGHLVCFDPTPIEVHRNVGKWFWDQAIFDYVGERLHVMDSLSSRTYLKAWERRKGGGNWKRLIDERFCHDTLTLLVQQLESNAGNKTVAERAREFVDKTRMSRATYFNYKRALASNGQLHLLAKAPRIVLRTSPPQDADLAAEVAKAQAENESAAQGHDDAENATDEERSDD